jgi:hypothetical protein
MDKQPIILPSIQVVPVPAGWSCTVRHPSGMVLAYGFAGNKLPDPRAESVRRALKQLA